MAEVRVIGGMNVFGWLTVLFVGLKLTGFITWPWYGVLALLWVPAAIFLTIVLVAGLVALVLALGK